MAVNMKNTAFREFTSYIPIASYRGFGVVKTRESTETFNRLHGLKFQSS